MNYTNKQNLPETIVKGVIGRKYKRGKCDFTVSEIIRPPMMNRLIREHYDKITIDVSTMQYALDGHAMHDYLEGVEKGHTLFERVKYWMSNVVSEKRYYIVIDGKIIGGKPDRIIVRKDKKSVEIQDYKRMGVYKYTKGINIEIEAQLNIYALRWIRKGYQIENLETVSMFRDWSWRKAKYSKDYPNQIEMMKVKVWDKETTEEYVKNRIREQIKEEPDKCTPYEMWDNNEKFAVMKKGRKSAVRLLDTKEEAEKYIFERYKNGKDVYIEHRKGERVRCEAFCIVNEFCKEYQKYKREQ